MYITVFLLEKQAVYNSRQRSPIFGVYSAYSVRAAIIKRELFKGIPCFLRLCKKGGGDTERVFATMILVAPNLEAGRAQFEQLTVQTTTPVDWENSTKECANLPTSNKRLYSSSSGTDNLGFFAADGATVGSFLVLAFLEAAAANASSFSRISCL